MPTSFSDIFFIMDPAFPPPAGTSLTAVTMTVTDQNDNGRISRLGNDRINGSDIRQVYPGDTVTIQLPSGAQITYTGVTFYLANGQEVFSPIDGQTLQNGTLVSTTFVTTDQDVTPTQMEAIPCFTPGTLIETALGPQPVETLREGDLVHTMDHGPQPIRWIGQRRVMGVGAFAPIRFDRGAIGNARPLLVSPQHRMLMTGWRAELHFGQPEVLVAAKHLVNGTTIRVEPRRDVTYLHLLFDAHEILWAEGVATESLHPGAGLIEADAELRAELTALFPELAGCSVPWPTARPVLRGYETPVVAAAA